GTRGRQVGHRTPRFQTSFRMEGDGCDQNREFAVRADGGTVAAIADAALAGEPVRDRRSENRNGGLGLATLIGEDHRDSEIESNLFGNGAGERTNMSEQPVASSGMTI